jgi:hypothetical protein
LEEFWEADSAAVSSSSGGNEIGKCEGLGVRGGNMGLDGGRESDEEDDCVCSLSSQGIEDELEDEGGALMGPSFNVMRRSTTTLALRIVTLRSIGWR